MRGAPPPLRFLTVVLGGWVAVRAAILIPDWAGTAPSIVPAPSALLPPSPRFEPVRGVARITVKLPPPPQRGLARRAPPSRGFVAAARPPVGPVLVRVSLPPPPRAEDGAPISAIIPLAPSPSRSRRWAASVWLFVREGERGQLATGGTLGGSQAGARLTYRLNHDPARPLALSLRAYAPLDRPRDGEAALGLEWQPLARVPWRLLAERREALGRGGRSAFAVLGHGGVSDQPVLGALRLDAYGQAGIVGLRARDPFADGAARVALPIRERLRIGGGIWGAAQPGAARLDVGPHISLRLPVARTQLWIGADWRVRVAGDAEPGSGPALTVASDF